MKRLKQIWLLKLKDGFFPALLFFLFIGNSVFAQQPILRNYNVRDGLASFETYCAFQDSRGFIWFGTDGGVSRFDGYAFKNYTVESGLADNTVFRISEDHHGRIWFRSLSGRLCYWHNDSIYHIGANDSIMKHIGNTLMTSFYIDSGDTIWCGIRAGEGYYKIYPGYTEKDFHCIKPGNASLYILEIENGEIIEGNVTGGRINELSIFRKNQFLYKVTFSDVNPGNMYVLPQTGSSYIVYCLGKLYTITDGKLSREHSNPVFENGDVTCLNKLGSRIWVGVKNKGVGCEVLQPNGQVRDSIRLLDGYSVSYVMKDNEGGTWFTTLENGVYYLSPKHFVREYELPPGQTRVHNYSMCRLSGSYVSISQTKDKIDLASEDTILRDVDLKGGMELEKLGEKMNLTPAVLVCTGDMYDVNNYTSYVWYGKGAKAKEVMFTDNMTPFISTAYITDTIHNKVYLLNRFDLFVADSATGCTRKLSSLPSRMLTCNIDVAGVVWLGCTHGLWSFSNNKMVYHGNDNKYLDERIEGLCCSADGSMFIGTYGNGMVIKKGNSYTHLTTANGLISNICEDVFIDSYNTVWVGSKSGLSSLVADGKGGYIITKYNLLDAMPSQRITEIEQTGNKLWLSSGNNIVSHTLPATEAKTIPSVFITAFEVNDARRSTNKDVELKYSENRIKISFVGFSYNSFGKITYKYRLEGLDSAWHTTQAPNVQYQFLPPGEYKFSLKAISADGVESNSEASLSFVINKPLWKTTWFTLLEAIVLAAFIYLFIQFRLRTIRKKEEERALVNRRIADTEMKALRAQMNPHFIFNAINSIQNHILKNDRKTAQDYLARFARLIRNVMENSKSEYIPLAQEMETLNLYVSLEQLRAGGRFQYNINVQPEIGQYNTLVPPLLLQPFVENAILHGLVPRQDDKGLLEISISTENGRLICTIKDNGIGRKKAQEIKKSHVKAHRSMGISATEDRVNILNKETPGIAGIMIIDVEEPSSGTIVTINIPLKTA